MYDMNMRIGSTRVGGFDSLPPHYPRALGNAEVLQNGYWVREVAVVEWIVYIE